MNAEREKKLTGNGKVPERNEDLCHGLFPHLPLCVQRRDPPGDAECLDKGDLDQEHRQQKSRGKTEAAKKPGSGVGQRTMGTFRRKTSKKPG